MSKFKINRIFAYIFIAISFINVIFSLFFKHASTPFENIFHYVESAVHIVLLIFLCKHAIKNKIGHFFHEYFMEAVIMGIMSTIGLISSFIINHNSLEDSFIRLLPVTLSLFVNIFLYFSFEHHHDYTVKAVTIIMTSILLVFTVNTIFNQLVIILGNGVLTDHDLTTLLPNILSALFNVFVILTFITMRHIRNEKGEIEKEA